jgi:hypothetical protein
MHWRLLAITTIHALLGMTAKYYYVVMNPLHLNVKHFIATATGNPEVYCSV